MASPETGKATEITDLPIELLSHVFDYLPLAEVLRSVALVSKLFYNGHRLHCRSTKKLTLIGNYMVLDRSSSLRNFEDKYIPKKDADRNRELIRFARFTGSSSSPAINPSTAHLKLVVGLEVKRFKICLLVCQINLITFNISNPCPQLGSRLRCYRRQVQGYHSFGIVSTLF